MDSTVDFSRLSGAGAAAAASYASGPSGAKSTSSSGNTIPGADENLAAYAGALGASLPTLPKPLCGGISMSGLSLDTLLDAVGFEQRRTETRAGVANLEAHAQERAEANKKQIELLQQNLEKTRSRGVLDGFLKAFKIIGMVLAAVASVAMIAVGMVGTAAGGSGALLIAAGVASMVMLASSITESATDGKAGFGPGFIAGKIAEAAGAGDQAVGWIKMGFDLLATIAMTALTFGASSASAAGNVTNAAAGAAGKVAEGAGKAAEVTAKAAQSADKLAKLEKVANVAARTAAIGSGVNGLAQGATSIANAVNERDISYLKAQRKRLDAILQRISTANEMDLDHLKTMMQRSEEILQTVGEIVKEGAQANIAVTTGRPPMMA